MPEARDIARRRPITGPGGPDHDMGQGAGDHVRVLPGSRASEAEVLTPNGLDDRSASARR